MTEEEKKDTYNTLRKSGLNDNGAKIFLQKIERLKENGCKMTDCKVVENNIIKNQEIIILNQHIKNLEHYIEELKKCNNKYEKHIKELEKYDSRKFIKEENKIKSPSLKKEEVDLMNLGISLYENFDKIFNDTESEEDI